MNLDKEEVKQQLAKLRHLVQMEIDYAFEVENEYRFTHETRAANDRKWKEFESFFIEKEDYLISEDKE